MIVVIKILCLNNNLNLIAIYIQNLYICFWGYILIILWISIIRVSILFNKDLKF